MTNSALEVELDHGHPVLRHHHRQSPWTSKTALLLACSFAIALILLPSFAGSILGNAHQSDHQARNNYTHTVNDVLPAAGSQQPETLPPDLPAQQTPAPLPPKNQPIVSKVTLQASLRPNYDSTNSFFLKFQNVKLTEKTLSVYYDPATFTPPTEKYAAELFHMNYIQPKLPTSIGSSEGHDDRMHLRVQYFQAREGKPECSSWVDQPTVLQHATWPGYFHLWRDCFLSTFQTMRETGLLPLVQIDAQGNMQEMTDGLHEGCPWAYDFHQQKVVQAQECRPSTGVIKRKKCDPETEAWCRPGVWSYHQESDSLPVILPASNYSVGVSTKYSGNWTWLFTALTPDIRPHTFRTQGACFKELYMVYPDTIDLYHHAAEENVAVRQAAGRAVKQFVHSIATHHQRTLRKEEEQGAAGEGLKHDDTSSYLGYGDPVRAWLRRGVGPEDLDTLMESVKPNATLFLSMGKKGKQIYQELLGLSATNKVSRPEPQLKPQQSSLERKYGDQIINEKEGEERKERPVVTYVHREMRHGRTILNDRDIYEYILSRYNVTLIVTTFAEPFVKVLRLLEKTDLFFGVHGAGLTNGIFLKEGAIMCQILPYGWRKKDGSHIRGEIYGNVAQASNCDYLEWDQTHPEYAFFQPMEFNATKKLGPVHPKPDEILPSERDNAAHAPPRWIFQNSYIDIEEFGPVLDDMMKRAGINQCRI